MNVSHRTLTTLVALAALIAAPALSTAAGTDACMLRDDCAPLTLYLRDGHRLMPTAPTEDVPRAYPLATGGERELTFATGVLATDVPLHGDGALTFRLHRDAVAPAPGTEYGTTVVLTQIDYDTGTRTTILEHTVWGEPDAHPDAAKNPLTGAGPTAEGYEAFAIPVSALTTDVLEAGYAYHLTLRLYTSAPTPAGATMNALNDATCTAGATLRTLQPGFHPCPIAWGALGPFDDVLYYDSVSHASHVTLPVAVAVAHSP